MLALTLSAQTPAGYRIDTIAGSNWIGDNGAATLAILKQAEGIASDSAGNLYLADAGNHRIREVTTAGVITTFAGTGVAGFSGDGGPASAAQLNSPYGLVFDGMGNLYVADLGNARVRVIAANGTIMTVAGGGSLAPGGANEGTAATLIALAAPRNVALDGYGGLYFSDFSAQRVYRVDISVSGGALTTIAGSGTVGVGGDNGLATSAQLNYPAGLVFDRNRALYIADSQNHLIRKIAGGVISSFARASTPTGLAIDAFGTLYVADPGAGQILAFPASGTAAAYATSAFDLTFAPNGYLYATQGLTAIRVSFAGPSTLVAGGGSLASGDQGPATNALLQHPSGVAADSLGNIYIADRDNNRIRKVAPDGTITTVAGTGIAEATNATAAPDDGDGGLATLAQLSAPSSVTVDATGNLYIADTGHGRVRKVTSVGAILAVPFPGLIAPVYALTDSSGNIYVADTGLGAILEMTPLGVVSTLADKLNSPSGFAFDATGDLYFTETGAKHVHLLDTASNLSTVADGIWSAPRGIAIGNTAPNTHDIFVADSGLQQILCIDSSGAVTVAAGIGSAGFAGDGGDAAAAQLNAPWDLSIDPVGTLYTADLNNNRVRRLTPDANAVSAPVTSTPLIAAVNAASLQPGPVAPGMLLDLLSTGLNAADLPNVQILFQTDSANVFPAQILSIDSGTVVLVAPLQIAASGNVQIQILNNSTQIAQITAVTAASAPGLFSGAEGQAIAVNQDGTLNSAANPAARGSVLVLYGTGQGISGLPVSVTVGGYAAGVLYSGPVSTYPGLWQINVQLPAGYVAPGTMAVIVNVNGASSQPGVFLTLN